LQLYKKGKSPTEVDIKLDLSPQETHSLYSSYMSLNNLHHFVETFKHFDNDLLQDFIHYYQFMEEKGSGKKEIAEAIKISNDFIKIKEEYNNIFEQLKKLQRETFIF
jgi:hypothetical protein